MMDFCCGVGLATEAVMNTGIAVDSLTLTEQDRRLVSRGLAYLDERGHRAKVGSVATSVFDPNVQALREATDGREFDLIISCNAFVHFSTAVQQRLIGDMYEQLSDDGMLVVQSHMKVLAPDWRNGLIEHMKAQLRATSAEPGFVERAVRHTSSFHNFVSTSDLIEWCHAAGFKTADCLFRRHLIGIIGAIK